MGYELLNSDQFFDALFSFHQGLRKFEADPYLYNNLAVTYGKTSLLDSALYFLSLADEADVTRQAAETNILGLIGKNEALLSFDLDSLFSEVVSDRAYMPSLVNTFMLANKYAVGKHPLAGENFQWIESKDSVLNSFEFAYVFNYAYNRPQALDSLQLSQLESLPEVMANANYYEALLLIKAYVLYQQNQVDDAMRILDNLQALNPFQRGYYNNVLGIWAMEQHAPQVATQYFEKAEQSRYEDALYRKAISMSEALPFESELQSSAHSNWDSLYRLSEEGIRAQNPVVENMRQIISSSELNWTEKDDAYKYNLLRYRFPDINEETFLEIYSSLEDTNYKVLILHDLWLKYPALYNDLLSEQIQTLISANPQLNELGEQYFSWLKAFMLENEQDWPTLSSLLDELSSISRWHDQLLLYYQARIAQMNNEIYQAENKKLLGNPFFVKGFLFALNQLENTDPLEKYNLLLEALESNPYAPALHKAYIETSLEAGLENYAESGLDNLRPLMSSLAFQDYLNTYDSLKAVYTPSF
ncbi:hypothetical protein OKW21_002593 [Catalinimonas alkaloidigena]|uniref:tetratricopeptide repeat protein n=1 Tax=Catalinimonas alkaloidigena TaxID=1075417 RepID=UPI002404C254|nr:hypothetical protein [Catalinimonas alkaloidigena]MDF9797330.1 hypothetical protein [Catalinimonas alkaloidigena]